MIAGKRMCKGLTVSSVRFASFMADDIKSRKEAIRQEIGNILNVITTGQIQDQSKRLSDRLFKLPAFVSAKTVAVYLSMEKEASTSLILQELFRCGKKVYVPKVVGRRSEDMLMLEVEGQHDIDSFPKVY
jgi:5-formyltetrahydrofolate cyclo-ligase